MMEETYWTAVVWGLGLFESSEFWGFHGTSWDWDRPAALNGPLFVEEIHIISALCISMHIYSQFLV